MPVKHTGKVFESNSCGKFEAIEYIGKARYKVRFIDTGYETTVKNSRMLDGGVIDRLLPRLCGFGFIGVGEYSSKVHQLAFKKWKYMVIRVYSKSSRKGTHRFCSIHKDWSNFQNFAKWHIDNYPTDGKEYELDKDKIKPGNKVYAPELCCYISHKENTQISNSRVHYVSGPNGELLKVLNMAKFQRQIGMSYPPRKVKELPAKRARTSWVSITESMYAKLMEYQNG